MNESVDDILLEIKERNLQLANFKKFTEEEIERLKNKLYIICQHNWVIDRSNYGEKTEYICSRCYSYK